MSCGCAQFLSPHRIKMKCSLFHIFTPLLQWYMSFVFSSAWLNTLGHNEFVHRPLLDITVPVGSFFAVSCTANLCLDQEIFFVAASRNFHYIFLQCCTSRVSILLHRDRRGLDHIYFSKCFAMSVQIFRPNSFYRFLIGSVCTLMQKRHPSFFSRWIEQQRLLCSWYSIHMTLDAW